MKFYLVRHGLKESIPPVDPALTNIGMKQAEATAHYLKTIHFQTIIASPKKRTQQTAQTIAEQLQLPIVTDTRLQERMEWEMHESLDVFLAEWDKTDKDKSYQPFTGDSSQYKGEQMRAVIEEVSQKDNYENILIVSHGGAIGDLLRNVFGEEHIPHLINPISKATYIEISECSVTIIEKGNDVYHLEKLGDTSHLSVPLT